MIKETEKKQLKRYKRNKNDCIMKVKEKVSRRLTHNREIHKIKS